MQRITTQIYVTAQFVGFHRWVNAPESVKFLRDYHRHVFHVKLTVSVAHNDRDVEFFTLKEQLVRFLDKFRNQYFDYSCEQIAEMIGQHFNAVVHFDDVAVEVSEDLENGATVILSEVEGNIWDA